MVGCLVHGAFKWFDKLCAELKDHQSPITVHVDVEHIPVDLADEPVVRNIAAIGAWLFHDDTSSLATDEDLRPLVRDLRCLRKAISEARAMQDILDLIRE
jgi:hypothetical protein